jgi:type I restriction enzyme, S subunit
MAAEWKTLTVDQIKANDDRAIAIGPFGSRMKADTYVSSGVPVIRGNNISDTRVFVDEFVYVSEQTADELRACNVFAGDLVFPHRGAIGQVGIIPEADTPRFMLSTSLMKLTCNKELVDPLFVFYFFRSTLGRHALLQHASTVGTPGIGQPLTSLRSIRLPIPPFTEQRAIAHILGTLDDKIELNRRRNQTLEAMARALFKDWFVDFGPVRAKMEGRDPYLPADLWQLFPDRLDDEGKPQGWGMRPLSELLTIIGGGTPKTSVEEYWGGDIPWFSVVDTPSASDVFVVTIEKTITDEGLAGSSARLTPKGTTIISARGTVGNLAIAGCDMTFNQSCYGLRGTGSAGDYFVYLTAQQMVDQLKSMAHGSVFSTITRQTFEAIRRPVPPPAVLTAFEGLATGWFDAILSSVEESHTLAQLRDTLLPKLISGELRITEAEKFMECVNFTESTTTRSVS